MHYAVIGLGFGDEGKGITVARLCKDLPIDFVVRYSGGAQAGHNVVSAKRKHCFKQFGSGTFSGVPTYMAQTAVFDPWAFEAEYLALRRLGLETNFTAHPEALVSTVYHSLANKRRNDLSGHGTVGFGIGEAKAYEGSYGKILHAGQSYGTHVAPSDIDLEVEPLRVKHLSNISLAAKLLKGLEEYYEPLIGYSGYDPEVVAMTLRDTYGKIAVDDLDPAIRYHKNVVFESSQGILLDEKWGFHPHTTWSDLTTAPVEDILQGSHNLHTIGVTRTYHTRHGAGPLMGESEEFTRRHKEPDNRSDGIQGQFRVAPLNLPLLSYAIDVVKPTSLAVTHSDKDYGTFPSLGRTPCDVIESFYETPISMYGYGPGVGEVEIDEHHLTLV